MAIPKEAPTPDTEESDASLAICDGEEPINPRMVHVSCIVGNTVSITTMRPGLSREERLSTHEVRAVTAKALARIETLLHAKRPVSHGGIMRITEVHIAAAEKAKQVANTHRGEIVLR